MSRLSNLLRQVETQDPQLAADLKREVEALSGLRAFGLNFERHIPETVELPNRPVRRGDKVRFLPEARREAEQRRPAVVAGLPGFAGPTRERVADLVRQSGSRDRAPGREPGRRRLGRDRGVPRSYLPGARVHRAR